MLALHFSGGLVMVSLRPATTKPQLATQIRKCQYMHWATAPIALLSCEVDDQTGAVPAGPCSTRWIPQESPVHAVFPSKLKSPAYPEVCGFQACRRVPEGCKAIHI